MTQLWKENVRSLEKIFINLKFAVNFIIFLMVFLPKAFLNVEQNDELEMRKSAFLKSFNFSDETTEFLGFLLKWGFK